MAILIRALRKGRPFLCLRTGPPIHPMPLPPLVPSAYRCIALPVRHALFDGDRVSADIEETGHMLLGRRICYGGDTSATEETHLLLERRICYWGDASATGETHLLRGRRICYGGDASATGETQYLASLLRVH